MTLSFQKVVGRPLNPSRPQETDFAISANDLTIMAEKVWKMFILCGMAVVHAEDPNASKKSGFH